MTRLRLAAALALAAALVTPAVASDHDDTNVLKVIPRHDARISDLFAFVRGENLVLILCTNPAIPPGVAEYVWPTDLVQRFHVDNDSPVTFDDAAANATWGGTIADPAHVNDDITFVLTFDKDNRPHVQYQGFPGHAVDDVRVFTGLRDDPFIRGPRIGRNVAAWVVEVPLRHVLKDSPVLLVWATTKVQDVQGPISEHGGRSLRSQFSENLDLNEKRPSEQWKDLGVVPDVIILDTSRPVVFPNGRELADDVVDMVGDPRVMSTDAPFPNANDMPWMPAFPYLHPPQ